MDMWSGDDRRIRRLIEMAIQAEIAGQGPEAARLRQLAASEGPQHPLILNEKAPGLLLAGDAPGAHGLLARAVQAAPGEPTLWLNFAAALRGMERREEELAALDRLLALEPRHLRGLLQKASLLALRGDARAAAALYRTALQTVPPGAELPPSLRAMLKQASRAVAANNVALEAFVERG